MKRQQAARYARWSAGAALVILLVVAGVYLHRRRGAQIAQHNLPPPVPPAVEEQSSVFTYSKTLKNHTLFTLRASRATEYKGKKQSLLEDVSISIYGPRGDRNDSVHARECSYDPASELIRCQGAVRIDIEGSAGKNPARARDLHLATSNIWFDRQRGRVSTAAPVSIAFPDGQGTGTGMIYDTRDESVTLEKDVQLRLVLRVNSQASPLALRGRSLQFERADGTLRLFGPVRAREGSRVLTAGSMVAHLDSQLRLQTIRASGQPSLSVRDARGAGSLEADRLTAAFGEDGGVNQFMAEGSVHGRENSRGGTTQFSANQVRLWMVRTRGRSEPRELTASGNVQVKMQQKGTIREWTTDSLRAEFRPSASADGAAHARLARLETLAPGEMTLTRSGESDRVRGGRFVAEFDASHHLKGLRGSSGVEILRRLGSGASQRTTAENLSADFGPDGDWRTVQESGNVHFQQGDRKASADRAQISRATNQLVLTGSAMLADAASQTTAGRILFNQETGDIAASEGVLTTYRSGKNTPLANLGSGPAHISADRMRGSEAAGEVLYSGHARLWQGDAVVEAARIELWREPERLEASGNVLALFAEPEQKKGVRGDAPTIWHIRSEGLQYSAAARRVELAGGVRADSPQGSISAERLALDLVSGPQGRPEIDRAVAEGGVRIEENGRLGTAERGEYFVREGKFILSGGRPALADASGNTTTGPELTFFLADDTILVSSKNGSRTMTKHRVQK